MSVLVMMAFKICASERAKQLSCLNCHFVCNDQWERRLAALLVVKIFQLLMYRNTYPTLNGIRAARSFHSGAGVP